jgi:hypothetical protein
MDRENTGTPAGGRTTNDGSSSPPLDLMSDLDGGFFFRRPNKGFRVYVGQQAGQVAVVFSEIRI